MNKIFTLFLSGIVCLTLSTLHAQTVTENFENGGLPLTSNCWTTTNMNQDKNGGTGNSYAATTKGTTTATLATPFIDITANGTIEFDYKASNNSTGYTLTVSIISPSGTTLLSSLSITNHTGYLHYTSPALTAGTYRVSLNYTSTAGPDGQNFILLDNLTVSGSYHYSSFCNQGPTGVNDTYTAPSASSVVTGNVLSNDTDPNTATHGEVLSIVSSTPVTSGTLNLNTDGSFSFTPNASFTGGLVTFTYTLTDNGYSPLTSTATVTINYPEGAGLPLPVKILSFTGSLANHAVLLSWTVDENETGDYFKVERSIDGKHFTERALVSTSNTKGKQAYSFTEPMQAEKGLYYRLQTVNKDASVSYSKTVFVRAQSDPSRSTITLLQNPVQATIRFAFNATTQEQSTIRIYSLTGSTVWTQPVAASKGSNYVEIEAGHFPKGMYILEVSSKTEAKRIQFIK